MLEVVLTPDDNRVDYILQDKKSTNHTYVNDQRVDHRYLKNGDVIRIGKSNFRFEDKAKGDFSETLELHETWFPGVFYTRSGKKKRKNKSVAQWSLGRSSRLKAEAVSYKPLYDPENLLPRSWAQDRGKETTIALTLVKYSHGAI